jgi:hypothetical protein
MLPNAEDAVMVHVEMHVQDITNLNEISSDFDIGMRHRVYDLGRPEFMCRPFADVLFTQLWHDSSLNFFNYTACKRNITMEPKTLHQIWLPNICIINSKSTVIHASPTENIMFILYEVRKLIHTQTNASCVLEWDSLGQSSPVSEGALRSRPSHFSL